MEMNGTVEIVDDVPAAFAKLASDEFAAKTASNFTIALSGGSTATPCYEALSKENIDWQSVAIVWGDEKTCFQQLFLYSI